MWRNIDVQADLKDLRSGSYTIDILEQRACPSTDTGPIFLWLLRQTAPFSHLLGRTWGCGGPILISIPQVPMEEKNSYIKGEYI